MMPIPWLVIRLGTFELERVYISLEYQTRVLQVRFHRQ